MALGGQATGDTDGLAALGNLGSQVLQNLRQIVNCRRGLFTRDAIGLFETLAPVEHPRLDHREQLAQAEGAGAEVHALPTGEGNLIGIGG